MTSLPQRLDEKFPGTGPDPSMRVAQRAPPFSLMRHAEDLWTFPPAGNGLCPVLDL